MGGQFWVDTDGLGRGGGVYRDIGDRVWMLASGTVASIEGIGNVWGNDSPGEKFAKGYLPAKSNFLTGVFALGAVLRGTAGGVQTMQKTFDNTEQCATELAGKVRGIMPDHSSSGDAPGRVTGKAVTMQPAKRRLAESAPQAAPGETRPLMGLVAKEMPQAAPGETRPLMQPVAGWVPRPLLDPALDPQDPHQTVAAGKRLGVAHDRLAAMDSYLRGEYKRRGLEYPEPFGPPAERLSADRRGPQAPDPEGDARSLQAAADRLLAVDEKMHAAAENLGLDYPGFAPTPQELREAGRRIGDVSDRLAEAQRSLAAKDEELRAEYARRGWDYQALWDPSVEGALGQLRAVSVNAPAPEADTWQQAVELSETADRLGEAKERVLAVDRTLRAAAQRLGWAYP